MLKRRMIRSESTLGNVSIYFSNIFIIMVAAFRFLIKWPSEI